MIRSNNVSAGAKKLLISRSIFSSIEEGALLVIEALCAKPMRWFSIAVSLCDRINQGAAPWGMKFIAILLIVPCFKASNLFLEICYFCMRRREFLLKLKIASVNGEDFFIKNIELSDNSRACFQLKKRLDDIASVVISSKPCGSKDNWVSHEIYSLKMDVRSLKADISKAK